MPRAFPADRRGANGRRCGKRSLGVAPGSNRKRPMGVSRMSTQVQAAAPSAYTSLDQIVAAVAAGKLNVDTASALLQRMQRSAPKALTAKVSGKGAVSVYGLQRMPVTLYVGQWERLLAFVDDLKAFIEEHRSELSVKG